MNKLEFINTLGDKLSILPPAEVQRILDYYVESIDDRMEDGMDESAAIDSLGSIDDLAAKILSEQEHLAPPEAPEIPELNWVVTPEDAPPPPPQPEKRRMSPGVIVLLVVGSPIWLSLLVAAFSVVLGLYITAWALLGALTVTAGALALSGVAVAATSFFVPITPNTLAMRFLSFGTGLVCASIGLALLPGALWLIGGFVHLHSLLLQKSRAGKETA